MLRYHIQTIEVGAAGAATIDFTNIPQIYDDLCLEVSARGNNASVFSELRLQINGATTGYSFRALQGTGSGAISFNADGISGSLRVGLMSGANSTASTHGNGLIYIPNYRSTANKSLSINTVSENNATTAYQELIAGLYTPSSPITTLTLSINGGSFVQHSSASLYGIKRGSDGRTEVASGGTITTSGGYTIHTFNSSGTFVANRDMDVEYLVIAGGGGGGGAIGGGGGAGGYRCSVVGESSGGGASAEQKLRVNSGSSYSVTIGAGGVRGGAANYSNGSNSSFASIVSIGGGIGGDFGTFQHAAGSGGSGGGARYQTPAGGGSGISGQGYAGGAGGDPNNYGGGGGGGAGAVGGNGTSTTGGNGGAGVTSLISGTSVIRAGGGGGGTLNGSNLGTGGSGGGGNSGNNNGTSNTGGGGGGAFANDYSGGGNGGSGVVIIRYLTPA